MLSFLSLWGKKESCYHLIYLQKYWGKKATTLPQAWRTDVERVGDSGLDEDLPAVCSAWPQLTQVCPERQHNHNSFASSLKPPHISKILRTDEKWKQTITQPILINVKRITSALSISYCRPFHNIFIEYHLISDSRLTPFNMKFPLNF